MFSMLLSFGVYRHSVKTLLSMYDVNVYLANFLTNVRIYVANDTNVVVSTKTTRHINIPLSLPVQSLLVSVVAKYYPVLHHTIRIYQRSPKGRFSRCRSLPASRQ